MDTRYPDVMSEELSRISDRTCIICREDMVGKDEQPNLPRRHFPKKLPCQHIFHFGCLRTWLERQQSCPTCRRPVLDAPTVTQQENAPQAAAAAAGAAEPPPVPPATSAPAPPPPTAETTPLLGSNVAAPSSSSSSSTTTTASRATLLPSTLSQTTATFTAKTTTSSIPPPSIPASMDALLQASLSTWLSQLPPPPPPPMMLAFTPEQLQTLSESHLTHANLEEKLRLLSLVHAHVSAAMQSLSQLLATLPSPPPPPPPPSSSAPPPSLFPVSSSSTDGN
ncbi:E3 ubiquitin-protein ligase hrd1 [Coelomomyces lativittatus]|nr:E3 ubiquitin-protein ligase hrd1 [Coelomomyces lativittatus]